MFDGMKIAVAVRAHRTTRKLEASLRSLSGSDRYDLFLAANETCNMVDSFGIAKLVHTAASLLPLGARYANEASLVCCSDVVFHFLRNVLSDYDFIILVEDDVHFPSGGQEFVESVVDAVRLQTQPVDLLGSYVRHAEPNWHWYADAKRMFSEVFGVFFPFVGMSKRAIDLVQEARRHEASSTNGASPIFCEAFTPSALMAAGGFVLKDVNDLVPHSYNLPLLTVGLPFLLEDPTWDTTGVGLAHPVLSAPEYLERRFAYARSIGDISCFVADLELRQAFFPASLRSEYAARAAAALGVTIMERLDRLEPFHPTCP